MGSVVVCSVTNQLALAPEYPSGLRWLAAGSRHITGKQAGGIHPDGYWSVYVDGVSRRTHHVVWFLTYGIWPAQLDHRDGNRSNNRVGNLRIATHAENMRNRRMPPRKLPQGVYRSREKYRGCVEVDGTKHRRTFSTVAEAQAWVLATRQELHGAFAVILGQEHLGQTQDSPE